MLLSLVTMSNFTAENYPNGSDTGMMRKLMVIDMILMTIKTFYSKMQQH